MTLFALIVVVGTAELLALVGILTIQAWPRVDGLGRRYLGLPPPAEQAALGSAPGAVIEARHPPARRPAEPGWPAQPAPPGG